MKQGTFVSWITKDGKRGFGQVIADESNSHVQVAVHNWDGGYDSGDGPPQSPSGQELEVHPVIYCTVTWLTAIEW